ncbi:hypothetical protein DLAC_00995 [Tieghemostelium lacteum]|uniref:Uncharacterized protein n=1 Tax=Tieghemostelium lacteum TaxID=361077 RepID=A0A152A7G3_TIELA|nr:hypothetical protein DLAC_00995 [Tieghemostelium lacteum]|eukprot:KYR02180.1 hypothetical protein DLAC_00995 [Tieghemostelium lacteum]
MYKEIIVILSILGFISSVLSVTYVTMTPYGTYDCSGEEAGIGYSFIVNQCFAIAGDFFTVELTDSNGNATIYAYGGSDTSCSSGSQSSKSYTVGDCYDAPNYVWNAAATPTNYVKVGYEVNPTTIQPYGFRQTTYAPGDSDCSNNPQFYWFATNDTEIKNGDQFSTWYCYNDESYEIFCDNGPGSCFTDYASAECFRDFTHWSTEDYVAGSC